MAMIVGTLSSLEEKMTAQEELRAVQQATWMEYRVDSLLKIRARRLE
jgi:hypothetical protein